MCLKNGPGAMSVSPTTGSSEEPLYKLCLMVLPHTFSDYRLTINNIDLFCCCDRFENSPASFSFMEEGINYLIKDQPTGCLWLVYNIFNTWKVLIFFQSTDTTATWAKLITELCINVDTYKPTMRPFNFSIQTQTYGIDAIQLLLRTSIIMYKIDEIKRFWSLGNRVLLVKRREHFASTNQRWGSPVVGGTRVADRPFSVDSTPLSMVCSRYIHRCL